HDHEVAGPATEGQLAVARNDVRRSSLRLEFDAAALRVTGRGEPPEDVPEVQRVMVSERVLDVRRYPKIVFESRTITVLEGAADQEASRTAPSGGLRLRVSGDLTLHGITQPVTVPVTLRLTADSLTADGRARVKQTDFGIRPVTAGAGTVRVKDEVDVLFSVTARLR
ncbi:MAG: YceI family protein, partial [Acidobacteria bacterium]|nr:YceI family protein [Acidobacteriota bacterium]